jgi:hypothetical protein
VLLMVQMMFPIVALQFGCSNRSMWIAVHQQVRPELFYMIIKLACLNENTYTSSNMVNLSS